jgi:hypothetical protein
MVPIRCGAAGVATSPARPLDDLRLLKEHAEDRCQGLGVIGVKATDVQVPGPGASRTRPLEFVPLERLMASSGLRPASPCPRGPGPGAAAHDGHRTEQARREPAA